LYVISFICVYLGFLLNIREQNWTNLKYSK
jgi:hypothetical protein